MVSAHGENLNGLAAPYTLGDPNPGPGGARGATSPLQRPTGLAAQMVEEPGAGALTRAGEGARVLGRHTDGNRPPWPGTRVTICVSYFTTGGPSKEHRTNTPPPTRRVWERSQGDTMRLTASQNPLASPILAEQRMGRQAGL